MTHSTDIQTLARWMASDFSNQAQAIENPPFFAHIRVCMRPLPWQLMDGASFYLEQAYDFALDPYQDLEPGCLCKDVVVDPIQIALAAEGGAAPVVLIATVLGSAGQEPQASARSSSRTGSDRHPQHK